VELEDNSKLEKYFATTLQLINPIDEIAIYIIHLIDIFFFFLKGKDSIKDTKNKINPIILKILISSLKAIKEKIILNITERDTTKEVIETSPSFKANE
jgi:hypothetical protein